MSKALRRHHRERMRKHCARILRNCFASCRSITEKDVQEWAAFRGDNFTVCSCWCCGNPRRMGGGNGTRLTRQEVCSLQALREELGQPGVTWRPAWSRNALGPNDKCEQRAWPQKPKV